jgi:hypothetical protein
MERAVKEQNKNALPISPWILAVREEFTTPDLAVLFCLVQPRRREIS